LLWLLRIRAILVFTRTSLLLPFLCLALEFLIHTSQVAVQSFDGDFLSLYVKVQARRLSALAIHRQDLIYTIYVQGIPRVFGYESEPHDLPENVGLL
jgi:hypothetical protein